MKKLLLAAALALPLSYLQAETVQISSAADFINFTQRANGGEHSLDAELMADIDLSSVCGESKGTLQPVLSIGSFDGNGHSISGIYIDAAQLDEGVYSADRGYLRMGLFMMADEVKDLTVKDGTILVGKNNFDWVAVGGIVGELGVNGRIEGCANDGVDIYITAKDDFLQVGGIAGDATLGDISKCYNRATISGYAWAGGIAAYAKSVSDCYNAGLVETTSGGNTFTGGIMPDSGTTSIVRCYNVGTVDGNSSESPIGGLVAKASQTTLPGYLPITDCFSLGEVKKLSMFAGSFAGLGSKDVLSGCYALEGVNPRLKAVGMVVGSIGGASVPVVGAEEIVEAMNAVWQGLGKASFDGNVLTLPTIGGEKAPTVVYKGGQPTGIEEKITTEAKVSVDGGIVIVDSPVLVEVQIVSLSGKVMNQTRVSGIQSFNLPQGIYIVRVGKKVVKVRI